MNRAGRKHEDPFLRRLFEASPQPVWVFDLLTLDFIFVNDAALKLHGYAREELLRMKCTELRPQEEVPAFLDAVRGLRSGGQHRGVWSHRTKDGRSLAIEVVSSPIKWAGRAAVLSALTESSAGAPDAHAVHQREIVFRLVVEHVEELAIFMLDREGRNESWNSGAERIVGYREDEILAKPFSLFFAPEDAKAKRPEKVLSTAAASGVAKVECELVRKDGKRVWASLVVTPYKDPSGAVTGFVTIIRDIGERKRADEEVRRRLEAETRARAEAEAASRSKDEFMAVVSHELRTPMTAILGWIWLLRSGGLKDDDHTRALEAIERNMKLQAQIIEQLLDISSIVTGKLFMIRRPTAPGPLLDAAVASVAALAGPKSVTIELSASTAAAVLADPHRLQQIFAHLLSNAVKFSQSGGVVRATLAEEGSSLVFRVVDQGHGIAPEFLPHLFDPLRQEEDSLTRAHGGLGIGLAIVRHLVKLHGGAVEAESQGRGRGATFTVRLPLAEPEASPLPEPLPGLAEFKLPHSLQGLKVLLVDDEADTVRMVCDLLNQCGAEVSAARSSSEALAYLGRGTADVMISDLAMPGEDGYALIRKVRSLPPDKGGAVRALALSARAKPEDRARALEAGYHDYLAKPFEPARLVAALRRLRGGQ